MTQTARLENWKRCHDDDRSPNLEGNVYGHPRMADGSYVWTSTLQSIDTENNVAVTRNTTYQLGEPAKEDGMTDKDKVAAFLTALGVEFEEGEGFIRCEHGMKNVGGYLGFYVMFEFTDSGAFVQLGGWE